MVSGEFRPPASSLEVGGKLAVPYMHMLTYMLTYRWRLSSYIRFA